MLKKKNQGKNQLPLHQLVKKDKFCILPFVHQYVATNGAVNLCCVADWDNPVSEHVSDLTVHWTSEKMQKIRQTMLDNKKESRCTLCYNQGDSSDRVVHNKIWVDNFPDIEIDVVNGNNLEVPVYLDLRPGRLCNLKCRMCFSDVSSAIAEELVDNPELAELVGDNPRDIKDWLNDPISFESVKKLIPHTHTLKLAGGEPLFMPGVLKLLRWMIESNNTNVFLDITTNGTRLQGKTYKLLEHFKKVIQFSMCGVGYTNDYIRSGADWNTLSEAYKKYRDMANTEIHIMSTVQLYNLWNIEKIIEFWQENKSENGKLIFNLVNYPDDLSIDLAEKSDRQERADILVKYNNLLGNESRIDHIIERLITVDDSDYTDILRKRWVQRTEALDNVRHQSILNVHPKLGEYYSKW